MISKLLNTVFVLGLLGLLASASLIAVGEMVKVGMSFEGKAMVVSGLAMMWSLILSLMYDIGRG